MFSDQSMFAPDGRSEPFTPATSRSTFQGEIDDLKRRIVHEIRSAVSMLEDALQALWNLDAEAAKEVRLRDDAIDIEEVEIEQACYNLLALQSPVAGDFRAIAFILKVNPEIERIADHASSIAKISKWLSRIGVEKYPQSLVEMGERVPVMCHQLLRAILNGDGSVARDLTRSDKLIDTLERELFDETVELVEGSNAQQAAAGLMLHRLGRELERVGDLVKSIAQELVYLETGEIIRHAKKRARAARNAPDSAAG